MTDDRREWYIYVLRDPRDNAVRYVGWTDNIKRRFSAHIRDTKKTHKCNWIRSLLLLDLQPIIEVIERGIGEWQSVEIYWIRHYRMQGARLTNATDGGEGILGMIVSQETREKIRQAHLGRKQPPGAIEKTRQANLGRKRSPEHIERMRQVQLGHKNSPEHTEKLRQSNLGRKHSPDSIEKRAVKRRGRKNSPEHIEKVRQSQLGRKRSPGTIERMRQAVTRERGVSVRRVEDGIVFASVNEAARSVDRHRANILRAITTHGTKCAGYHWERVGETPPADPYTLDGNALVMRID